ncbi:hypothetical protein SMAC4_13695 [Sordaria macrospora]|uniref:uncharacterized protein n=1 Tax=Sordaria macrospora TaxID=5147 RepID=UPI002B2B38C7|nr:hypothetical protein SMAC4_13695 [Sordaria macrospora]
MTKNTLTTNKLLAQLSTLSNTESRQTNLTIQVKTTSTKTDNKTDSNKSGTNTGNNNDTSTSGKGKGKGKLTCSVCNNNIQKDYIHCVCGRHRSTKITTCWWCEPDKAPDTWPNKAEARKHNTGTTAALGNTNTTLANPATSSSALLFNGANFGDGNFNLASLGGNLGFH